MSAAMRCDNCGVFAPASNKPYLTMPTLPVGWLRVFLQDHHSRDDVKDLGQTADVCSRKCGGDWLAGTGEAS